MVVTPAAVRWRGGKDPEFHISLSYVERKGKRGGKKRRVFHHHHHLHHCHPTWKNEALVECRGSHL